MKENFFGIWENLQYTYNYLEVLKNSCQYSFFFALNYIDNIVYFPEVYDICRTKVSEPYDLQMLQIEEIYQAWLREMRESDCEWWCSGIKDFGNIIYANGIEHSTHTNRILPHYDKSRGWRSARMIDFHSTLHPWRLRAHNITYPMWAQSFNALIPPHMHDIYQDGFMGHYHRNRYSYFEVLMIWLKDDDLLWNYSTEHSYEYKDYITKNNNKDSKIYFYDFMETKIPKVKMKNFFFHRGNYYNDSMTKDDFLHHDYKNSAILTTNYFLYDVKNYYIGGMHSYSKFNPGVWKENTQTLTGLYVVYYDYFGSPEPRWLTQFSYALENIFHYWNRIYVINKDLVMKSWYDNNKFYYKKGHPIMMHLHWFEWNKIQDDNLIFRNPIVSKKR